MKDGAYATIFFDKLTPEEKQIVENGWVSLTVRCGTCGIRACCPKSGPVSLT